MLSGAILVARFFEFASILVLFGTALFYFYGHEARTQLSLPVARAFILAPILALIGILVWVATETALLLDDNMSAFDPASLWWLLSDTRIGQVHLLRIALLFASIAGFWLWASPKILWTAQTVLGGAMTTSFALSGHGSKDMNILHIGADMAHLLAASVWIGALVPLGVLIGRSVQIRTETNARIVYDSLNRFSNIGPVVVAVLVLTGLVNSWFLVGITQWRALFMTSYGAVLIAKLVLFAFMFLLAAANRYHLSPLLKKNLERGTSSVQSLRHLRISVLTETALAMMILAAVAALGTLNPSISMAN